METEAGGRYWSFVVWREVPLCCHTLCAMDGRSRYLSEFERGMVVGMHMEGVSFREIARRLERSLSAVQRAWREWSVLGRTRLQRRPGRPRATTAREDRALVHSSLASRTSSSRQLGAVWPAGREGALTTRTVRQRLLDSGLRARRALQRIPLTLEHRRIRHEWVDARHRWIAEWRDILFSDESRFELSTGDARILVRRRRGERVLEQCVQERPIHRQPGIMVWGAISHGGRTRLLRVQQTMTGQRYVDEVLRPVVLPYVRRHPRLVYMHDNARPHIARVVQTFVEEHHIRLLPWPAHSPDLNPIEHVWDMIGRTLSRYPAPPPDVDELWRRVQAAWLAIPPVTIQRLIDSMPRRVAMVRAAHGGYSRY